MKYFQDDESRSLIVTTAPPIVQPFWGLGHFGQGVLKELVRNVA